MWVNVRVCARNLHQLRTVPHTLATHIRRYDILSHLPCQAACWILFAAVWRTWGRDGRAISSNDEKWVQVCCSAVCFMRALENSIQRRLYLLYFGKKNRWNLEDDFQVFSSVFAQLSNQLVSKNLSESRPNFILRLWWLRYSDEQAAV